MDQVSEAKPKAFNWMLFSRSVSYVKYHHICLKPLYLQLRETKTAKGGSDCPTLLHYLARVLLRSDHTLVSFVEEMPHLEAAARGKSKITAFDLRLNECLVSSQIIISSVHTLSGGLNQISEEIRLLQQTQPLPNDRFTVIMKV